MNDQNLPEMTRQEAVEIAGKLQEIFDKQYAYLKFKALEMGINDILLTNWGPNHYLVSVMYDDGGPKHLFGMIANKVMGFFR
jgi:hypothetical protein